MLTIFKVNLFMESNKVEIIKVKISLIPQIIKEKAPRLIMVKTISNYKIEMIVKTTDTAHQTIKVKTLIKPDKLTMAIRASLDLLHMEAKRRMINNPQEKMLTKITSLMNQRIRFKAIRIRNPANSITKIMIEWILKTTKEMTILIVFKVNLFMESKKAETIKVKISLAHLIIKQIILKGTIHKIISYLAKIKTDNKAKIIELTLKVVIELINREIVIKTANNQVSHRIKLTTTN